MKQLLYPLVATALVTITPFLATFEKGQDIVHGLFDYSVLALLLLFLFVRDKVRSHKFLWLFLLVFAMIVASSLDFENILAYKGATLTGWRGILPPALCLVATLMVMPVKSFSLKSISLILFASLALHIGALVFEPNQPLFEFPVVRALPRLAPSEPSRTILPESIRVRYNATDSVHITKHYVDTTRSNVLILVESWGISMDTNQFNAELAVFGSLLTEPGIHSQMLAVTRRAEREELLESATRGATGKRDTVFLPRQFRALGYKTSFLFGGDSTIRDRKGYIRNVGFDNAIFMDTFTSDALMAAKLDSVLQDSTQRHFVAWTTRDTQFPMEGDAAMVEEVYYKKLFATLKTIAKLAEAHPEVRFIVQGDHEPILAPKDFMAHFYRRWVPYVVLN